MLEKDIKDLSKTEDFGSDTDHGDEESDEDEQTFTNINLLSPLKERLRNINWALQKMINGKYGTCEKCKKEISLELLKVDPESTLCKECKMKSR